MYYILYFVCTCVFFFALLSLSLDVSVSFIVWLCSLLLAPPTLYIAAHASLLFPFFLFAFRWGSHFLSFFFLLSVIFVPTKY